MTLLDSSALTKDILHLSSCFFFSLWLTSVIFSVKSSLYCLSSLISKSSLGRRRFCREWWVISLRIKHWHERGLGLNSLLLLFLTYIFLSLSLLFYIILLFVSFPVCFLCTYSLFYVSHVFQYVFVLCLYFQSYSCSFFLSPNKYFAAYYHLQLFFAAW